MYYLGLLKLYGITLSKDVKGAAHYFTKAANLGHADSQTAVRCSYMMTFLMFQVHGIGK